jgi:hypothetical protein
MPNGITSRGSIDGGRKKPEAGQNRNWVFTVNNPTGDDVSRIRSLEGQSVKYLRCKPERGESGTLHLQGLVLFTNARTFEGVKRLFGGAHLEVMRGSVHQALTYVEKEESSAIDEFPDGNIEFGTRPKEGAGGQGSRTDLLDVYDAVRSGKRGIELIEANPAAFIKYNRGIECLVSHFEPVRTFKTDVFWFYGGTGTGKSRKAFEDAEAAGTWYVKDPGSSWWDGYCGQHSVIVDDYRRDMCTFSSLLRLFDRYPLPVQVKGGYRQFSSRVIYVTTPKKPEDRHIILCHVIFYQFHASACNQQVLVAHPHQKQS